MAKKYKIAKRSTTGCKGGKGHLFQLIKDRKEKLEIRKEHPKLKHALWKCERCGCIIESM